MAGALAATQSLAARPPGLLIETHIHLFAGDPGRFPYSSASYQPRAAPVEAYVKFAQEAKIDHAVIVHPEPYQDDHRYLEYCFSKEPFRGFFKGTCLFDPVDPASPKRMQTLVRANPGRIVALRIHEVHPAGTPSATSGVIRDRDLQDPQMLVTWRAAQELGLAIQMHFVPAYASSIGQLAKQFPDTPVILDHLARPGQGTPEEYDQVLRLSQLPRVYMKFSSTGVAASSHQPYPHLDAQPTVKRVYSAFGPDRMMWGELGASMAEFDRATKLFDTMFEFAPESGRSKIRGLTAQKLFTFS
jgi:predicted TIM-barrel fold metal-dependent hydrolase